MSNSLPAIPTRERFPAPRYLAFVSFWTVFGGLSAVLLALAVSGRVGSPVDIDRVAAQ